MLDAQLDAWKAAHLVKRMAETKANQTVVLMVAHWVAKLVFSKVVWMVSSTADRSVGQRVQWMASM